MLLSTGADRTLRLWDLVEGRGAHITRTKGEASKVCWNGPATSYLLILGARVEVLDVETSTTEFDIDVGARVLDACFLAGTDFVATADGAGCISVWRHRAASGGGRGAAAAASRRSRV